MLTLLLPEQRRFAGQPLHPEIAKALGKGNRLPVQHAGEQAQLERHVSILPRRWPMAALTRQFDARDAEQNAWLRADPANVRADMGAVRLMAYGDLGLSQHEADEFIRPLKILFGDVGFPLSAPNPARWYLMLPKESKLPIFVPPGDVIGADFFAHFPQDETAKRWRSLINEAQIILHNHPQNAVRISKGLLPVNSLYFWGGGVLPDQVKFRADQMDSDDVELGALFQFACRGQASTPKIDGSMLKDCRGIRDWAVFEREHLMPALIELKQKKYSTVTLDFADGRVFEIQASQKWRVWRKAIRELR